MRTMRDLRTDGLKGFHVDSDMMGPSDMYGDLTLEDVEEFEGLQPDDEREINPYGNFQRGEVRSFDRDFEWELDSIPEVEEEEYIREAE
jgi:hypothetical protein